MTNSTFLLALCASFVSCAHSLRFNLQNAQLHENLATAAKKDAEIEPRRIPRKIWQVWVGSDLPKNFASNAEALQKANPTFAWELVTDDKAIALVENTFDQNTSARFAKLMKSPLGAAKADIIRYAALYANGGFYLDLDAHCKDLEAMIQKDDSAVLSHERNYGQWVQWGLAFEARHPILKRAIDIAMERLHSKVPQSYHTTKDAVLWATGPKAFSQAVHDFNADFEEGKVEEASDGKFKVRRYGTMGRVGNQRHRIDYKPNCQDKFGKTDYVGSYEHQTIDREHIVNLMAKTVDYTKTLIDQIQQL